MEMTAEEICRNYMQSADPGLQVEILADLNITSKAEIIRILEERGIKVRKRKPTGRRPTVWTPKRLELLAELLKQNMRHKDIAKELGIANSTLTVKLSEIKRTPQLKEAATE